jgi:hypothetical protein
MGDLPPITQKYGVDTTDFKTGIAAMSRELRVLESGFKATASGMGDWSSNATGLEARIKSLTSQIDVQQDKVAATRIEYERLAAEKGANSVAAQNLLIKLNNETATLGKMQSELGQTETALSGVREKQGDAEQSTGKFRGALDRLEDGLGKIKSGLGHVAGGLGSFAGKLKDLTGTVLKGAVFGIAGLAAGAAGAVAGLGGLVLKTAATSDELVELSDKVGIGVEALQEYKFIGEQTGTSLETVTGSMARLIRGMNDTRQGTGTAKDAFAELGISVLDVDGNLRDSQVVFGDALDALGGIEDETLRDALAMEIFGKSAQELNPIIDLGTEGLYEMMQAARESGAVMSEETVVGMAALHDSVASIKMGFQGLVGTLAAEFLPIAQQLIAWIETVMVPWLREHLPAAIETLKKYWSETLLPAIEAVWLWMSTVLIPFLQDVVFPWLQENIPKALQTLSDFWSKVLRPAIEAVWAWMSTVLIPFLQDTVFPWLQEHIPKALQTLSDFWTNVLQPAVKEVWAWLSGTLVPFLTDLFSRVTGNYSTALGFWAGIWTNTLLPAITDIWDFIEKYLMPIFETVIEIISIGLTLAITALAGLWQNTLLPALEDVRDFVRDEIGPKLEWLKTKIIDPLTTALGTGLKKALEWINEQLQKLKDLLSKIKLPPDLTPGSPTPFETGIRGIINAMDELNRMQMPQFSAGLAGLSTQARITNRTSLTVYGNMVFPNVTDRGSFLQEISELMP